MLDAFFQPIAKSDVSFQEEDICIQHRTIANLFRINSMHGTKCQTLNLLQSSKSELGRGAIPKVPEHQVDNPHFRGEIAVLSSKSL